MDVAMAGDDCGGLKVEHRKCDLGADLIEIGEGDGRCIVSSVTAEASIGV